MKQAWDVKVIKAAEKIRGPPRVPTSAELKFYENYLKEAKKGTDEKEISQRKNVLILGATPELSTPIPKT